MNSSSKDRSIAQRQPTAQSASTDRRLADLLDAASTEQVLRRAIDLETELHDDPLLFSPSQIEKIAGELGVEARFVRQAIGEVRASSERSRFDRTFLGDAPVATQMVEATSSDAVERSIAAWMTEVEGYRLRRRHAQGADWEEDGRILSRLRTKLLAGKYGLAASTSGDITHRIHHLGQGESGESEYVVSLESHDHRPSVIVKTALVAAALWALPVAAFVALFAPWFVSAILGIVPAAGIVASGVSIARRLGRKVRRGIERSLSAMVETF